MALPKTGSRYIVVDELRYRWRIRHKPSYGQGLAETGLVLAVELATLPACTLLVQFQQSRPDNWLGKVSISIKPGLVAQAIRLALSLGWQAANRGSAFVLKLTPSDLAHQDSQIN